MQNIESPEAQSAEEAFRQQISDLLAETKRDQDGDDPWWAIAASQGRTAVMERSREAADERSVVEPPPEEPARPKTVAQPGPTARESAKSSSASPFVPRAPRSLEQAGLSASEIEALVLKYLLNRGLATGRQIADQVKLAYVLVEPLLRQLKEERLVVYKSAAAMSDYLYELTDLGVERARRYSQQCTYFGTAPVALDDYAAGIAHQSVTQQRPRLSDLRRAFDDLVVNDEILSQLGQAINSGLGLFLYGAPGNGKTSIAERVTRAFGEGIWIPRAVSVLGEIIRLYDPSNHAVLPLDPAATGRAADVDHRWVFVRRPMIAVGGELTIENLEISTNSATNISEAPLQMKANGGVLVIDDFGRQRISPADLLNRWIVPLEKRYDFLNLSNGRKIQVPFDQLIIFSTNLEPRDLVDEAFLRRIPYKIDVSDPTEAEFRNLFVQAAEEHGVEFAQPPIDRLIEVHYRRAGRAMRFCHPRDLIHQMRIFCEFHDIPPRVSDDAVAAAVRNYFAMM